MNILVLLVILELDIHGFRGFPQPLVIVRLLLQLVLSLVDLLGQVDATLQLVEDGEVGRERRKVVRCIGHHALAAVSHRLLRAPGNLDLTFSERSHEHSLHLLLLRSDELQGQTGGAGTRRSARPMDIGIGSARKLVVHDVRNRRDVKSTRSDVRGEENAVRRGFEPEERAV